MIYADGYFNDLSFENTVIIMDTNVWLDIYILTPESIKEIIDTFNTHIDYFWMPHQVKFEYDNHRNDNRKNAINRYRDLKSNSNKVLNKSIQNIKSFFQIYNENGSIELEDLWIQIEDKLRNVMSFIGEETDKCDKLYQNDILNILTSDRISEFADKLYTKNTVKVKTRIEMIKLYEEAELRYKYCLSPGFTDKNKSDNDKSRNNFRIRKYGDFLIWKEILEFVNDTKKNILFIENERKSDWWDGTNSDTKIPYNMIEEYNEVNNNGKFAIISFEEFLFHFGNSLGLEARTVTEISNKINHENLVTKYLNDQVDEVLSKYLQEEFDNPLSDVDQKVIYKNIMDYSFFGGVVEEYEDVAVGCTDVVINYTFLDKQEHVYKINFKSTVDMNLNIIEHVNEYVTHSGRVDMKILLNGEFSSWIDVSDCDKELNESYRVIDLTFNNVQILEYKSGGYDVDVIVDEDMFRQR